ncbi:MAG: hypothetical protein MJB14_17845, partial [Spirochaetes bacterium]|nr:hypothetical protein [Spirochaetota bacterium]
DNISDELKMMIGKINQSGMAIEDLFCQIDEFITDDYKIEKKSLELVEQIDLFMAKNDDLLKENKITIKKEMMATQVVFSEDLFQRILLHLVQVSIKGFKVVSQKDVFIKIMVTSDEMIIVYGDSSHPLQIDSVEIQYENVLKTKRCLSLIFLKNILNFCQGEIKYYKDEEWKTITEKLDLSFPCTDGMIIQIPLNK